jgi:hypothetical protein
MPICLNLLAEAQAVEELRRRDPVKRTIWVAGLLVSLMLVWSSSLQLKAMLARKDLNQWQAQLASNAPEHQRVLDDRKKADEIKRKLAALRELAASRFLNGTLLNALQQSTVGDAQLVRLRVNESYNFTAETQSSTNDAGRITPAKPATVTEKVVITLDAKDSAPNAGDQVNNKLKEALAGNPYFQAALGKTNEVRLINLQQPSLDAAGHPFVLFTLECRYPEKTR